MYQLFSQTNTTGSRHTAARFTASWNAPMLVVPSPKKHTVTWPLPRILRGPGQPAGDRQVRADDRVGTVVAVRHAGDVHRAALAAADPALPAEQLGQHRVGWRAAGQRVRVTPVGAQRVVAGTERRGGADRDGFLAQPQMNRAVHQALPVQRIDPFLEPAQETHPR